MNKVMANYHAIAEEKPICFVPLFARDFIVRNKLDEILNINYLHILEAVSTSHTIDYDLCTGISCFTTVVQYAVTIAIYMGFKEIYLLGCDSTNIVSVINCAMNIPSYGMHAYDDDDINECHKMILKSWNMSDILWDQYTLFVGYRELNNFCRKESIKLVNCSSTTLVNEVPRMKLDDVLPESL